MWKASMPSSASPARGRRVRRRRRPLGSVCSRTVALRLTLTLAGIPSMALGETTAEGAIRALDAKEAEAMLAADLPTLEQLWSRDFIVNAPDDKVKSRDEVLQAVRDARIRYSAFRRTVERIVFRGDCAISMGGELVIPKGDRPDAGQNVSRRYSHVWQKRDDSWVLIARHANVTKAPTE